MTRWNGIAIGIACWGFLAASCLSPGESEAPLTAGSPDRDQQRPGIIGGERYAGLPQVGALLLDARSHCTGTLIAPRLVLTAAHCLEGLAPAQLSFAVGPSARSPERVLAATDLEIHPGFDPATLEDDLGLLTLAQDAGLRPLTLLAEMDTGWRGQTLRFVGYGLSDGRAGSGLGVKRAVDMAIDRVQPTQLAFGGPGTNICDGDSGAPGLYTLEDGSVLIAAVVSSGDTWCERVGVATRVDPYLEFLGAAPADPCAGETFFGRCEGDRLIWCEDETVYRADCATQGAACGLAGAQGNDCVAPAADPCGGETYEGRCEGDQLIWCEDGAVLSRDCAEVGAECGDYGEGGYFCLEP